MKCAVCSKKIVHNNKHSGRKRTRPICSKMSCANAWTYRQRKEYYAQKHRDKYWMLKETKYKYLRSINSKAKSVQRYGVEDRGAFIRSRGAKCQNCDSEKHLRIHHIDNRGRKAELFGEKPNNADANLMIVCQRCHLGHHRYGWELKMKIKSDTPSNRRQQWKYHVFSYIYLKGTHFVAGIGMQDETEFFKRLGFGRSIGYITCEYEIYKGELKTFTVTPRFYPD